jgi:hypothetical protein
MSMADDTPRLKPIAEADIRAPRAVPDFDSEEATAVIQSLYGEALPVAELHEAATNLLMFFTILLEEDERRRSEVANNAILPDRPPRGITST